MKAWAYRKDVQQMFKDANRDDAFSRNVTLYGKPPHPLNCGNWVEIEIPDPPKPFEAEVWVCQADENCRCFANRSRCCHPNLETCRKITLIEKSND